jgi:hypothetical protein
MNAAEKQARFVELTETYPLFVNPHFKWWPETVLLAGKVLDELPVDERIRAANLLHTKVGMPEVVVESFQNLVDMDAKQRLEVFRLGESGDEHNRGIALTMALRLPPPPDPAHLTVEEIVRLSRRALKNCRDPEVKPLLQQLAPIAREALKLLDAHQKARREAAET